MNMKILQKYMIEKGITQDRLARLLGTTKFTLSRWMNGKNKPSQAYVRIIEDVCGSEKCGK
jgi:transcriptional regulator with XRE-family HTH domain